MGRYIAARAAQALIVVAAAVAITFFLVRFAPGDPFASEGGIRLDSATQARQRHHFGLDRPPVTQFGAYLVTVARGDLGFSLSQNEPVTAAIGHAMPRTLVLVGTSFVIAIIGGIGLGLLQARRIGSAFDRTASTIGGAVYAVPEFALALVIMTVFAGWLGMPTGTPVDDSFADTVPRLILPVATLSIILITIIARYQRSAVADVLPLDFIRTARAKGASERRVLIRHAARNSVGAMLALFGLMVPTLVAGAFFIEHVFAWNGMGELTYDALSQRDYALVTGSVLVTAAMVALGNLIADVLHAALDPRIRHA